jgi:hypothetical protein
MNDLAGFLKRSAAAYREVKSFGELEELSKILQHYLALMFFWVDLAINWSEVNDTFHDIGYVKE